MQSEKHDLWVYYLEEADYSLLAGMAFAAEEAEHKTVRSKSKPTLGSRGIRAGDVQKEISQRRKNELDKSAHLLHREDSGKWVALKRSYCLAEQWVTHSFKDTVVFPFGGSFGITRCGALRFGWTNSQPLDLLDGYDLLSAGGEALLFRVLEEHSPFLVILAFPCKLWSLLTNLNKGADWETMRNVTGRRVLKLVVRVCRFQQARGLYFLIENPATSLAWVFDGIMAKLLKLTAVRYVIGDNKCRYGKTDKETGRPVKKPNGWLSNSEFILNAVGKRCTCPWGAHQAILGSNKFGLRSTQAAAYPSQLCLSICEAVLRNMRVDYAVDMSTNATDPSHAFPVFPDDSKTLEQADQDELRASEDSWSFEPPDRLYRLHHTPRMQLCFCAVSHHNATRAYMANLARTQNGDATPVG